MTLQQLRYFETVARCGSISRAAEVLFIAQPTISVALRELEQELGFPLLERGSFGARPTGKGNEVLTHIHIIFAALEQIRDMAHADAEPLQESYSVGVDCRFSARLLSETILELGQIYPKLKLQMESIYSTEELLRQIAGGRLLGCVALVEDYAKNEFFQNVQHADLCAELLLNSEMVFIVRPEHPLADREKIRLEEMLQYPYATIVPEEMFCQSARYKLFKAHYYRQETIFFSDTSEIEHFVLHSNKNPFTLLSMSHNRMRQGDGVERFHAIHVTDVPFHHALFWVQQKQGPGAEAAAVIRRALQKLSAGYLEQSG